MILSSSHIIIDTIIDTILPTDVAKKIVFPIIIYPIFSSNLVTQRNTGEQVYGVKLVNNSKYIFPINETNAGFDEMFEPIDFTLRVAKLTLTVLSSRTLKASTT
jgi:hypothetical protein